MKYFRYALLFGCLMLGVVYATAWAATFPPPRGKANDFANIFQASQLQALDAFLEQVWLRTRTALVLVTLDRVPDGDIETAAHELYAQWGIGDRQSNKGVLLLASMQDRRVRIETGYGMEGALPDAKAGRILDQQVLPLFRQGNYADGLQQGILALAQVIAQDAGVALDYTLPRAPPAPPAQELTLVGKFLRFIFLIFMIILFFRYPSLFFLLLSSSGGGRSGGGFGSGGSRGGFGGGLSGGGGASRGW